MAKLSFLLLIVTTISIVFTYWSCRLLNLENNQSRLHWPIGLTMIAVATITKPIFIAHLLMNLVGGCLLGFSLLWDESTINANHGIDSSKQISSVFWSLVLLCLGGVVVLVRVPSIFDYGLRWDEHWHLSTVLGYFKEGRYTTWNFRRGVPTEGSYLRAWLYTWQVAQFTRWFRNPLYSARVVSLIWGVMALVPFYLLFRRMRVDQLLMMLGITWFAFSPQLITVSRWGRFYSFFLFTYLFLVYCLFEFLLADDFLPRILYGFLTVGLFVLGSHLNPLTFLIIPAIYGFLAYEILAACNLSFPLPEFRLDHVLAISAGMSSLILTAFFYFEFNIQPNAIVNKIVMNEGPLLRIGTGDLKDSLSLIPQFNYQYLLFLCQDHLGYGLGAFLLSSVAIPSIWTREIERYLYSMIFIPMLLIIFFTSRTPQVRYVVPFIALSIPLFIGLLSKLSRQKWTFEWGPKILLALIIIATISYELPARSKYIYSGNYGYIHSPGVRTPKYRSVLRWLEARVAPDQSVEIYYWNYFYYVHPFYRAQFDHDRTSFQRFSETTRVRRRVKEMRQKTEEVWIIYPDVLEGLMTKKDQNFLSSQCVKKNIPEKWYIQVHFCD